MKYEALFTALRNYGKGRLCADRDAVSQRAYKLWEDAGCPPGDGEEFWLKAEKQVLDEAADEIIKKVFSPAVQEAAASLQLEAADYAKYATRQASVAAKKAMERDQLVLPDGVRYHRRVGEQDYIIFEESPKIRTVLVDMSYSPDRVSQYGQTRRGGNLAVHEKVRIALPYVVYAIRLHKGTIQSFQYFFRNAPIKTMADELFLSHLPNTEGNGRPCVPWPATGGMSLTDAIRTAITAFWSTEFNYSLTQANCHPSPSDAAYTFQTWAKATVDNPLFVLKTNWMRAGLTVASLIPGDKDVEEAVAPMIQGESNKFVKAAANILALELPKPPEPAPTPKSGEKTVMPGTYSTITWA